ncbi:MAG: hypothetical protein HY690_12405 [Chloroflexi bacterium]|nr:hypothetical protein [Chloroflexota bacterium]
MAISFEATPEQRLQTVQRLLQTAQQAYTLARHLNEEIARIRAWEQGPRVSVVGYSLGICQGDVEVAASRLGGLRNELEELAGTLEQVRE